MGLVIHQDLFSQHDSIDNIGMGEGVDKLNCVTLTSVNKWPSVSTVLSKIVDRKNEAYVRESFGRVIFIQK